MSGEPSGSLNSTLRSSPLRATWIDKDGMPIAFSPPCVSRLKVSVAEYFSGSRVLMFELALSEFALTFSAPAVACALALLFAFAFAFAFEFFGGRQELTNTRTRITSVPTVAKAEYRLLCIKTSLASLGDEP